MRPMAASPPKPARILLVKTSSLGDVIHNLPVASDIRHALPEVTIDWACEPPYAPLVALHPAVNQAFPIPLRHLKKHWRSASAWREFNAMKARLAAQRYDLILDTQGLAKSAWIASFARGPRAGYDRASAREPLASLAYGQRYAVSPQLHAVTRNRELAAVALGYKPEGPADYGLSAASLSAWDGVAAPYAVFLHATSRADKLWPTERWIALGRGLRSRGLGIVLPWGTPTEREESLRIATGLHGEAAIPPALSLPEAAGLLAHARCVVGVDTGLAHLAVAVGRPTVGLYCATDPGLTGLHGDDRAVNLGGMDRLPAVEAVLATLDHMGALA
jgi:heptosyltransferase I